MLQPPPDSGGNKFKVGVNAITSINVAPLHQIALLGFEDGQFKICF